MRLQNCPDSYTQQHLIKKHRESTICKVRSCLPPTRLQFDSRRTDRRGRSFMFGCSGFSFSALTSAILAEASGDFPQFLSINATKVIQIISYCHIIIRYSLVSLLPPFIRNSDHFKKKHGNFALHFIFYGPCIILQYIRNPTRYTIFDD